jgi:hypothetical protein
MSTIKIILSSANMGDVDEVDFDCWASFVCDSIDEALGIEVRSVEQFRFGEGADIISGATDEQEEEIRRWLGHEGWDAFCGEEWNKRRAARDAA